MIAVDKNSNYFIGRDDLKKAVKILTAFFATLKLSKAYKLVTLLRYLHSI